MAGEGENMLGDTIAAISTPPGRAGIGIIRISGKDAVKIAALLFRSPRGQALSSFRPRYLHYGFIVDPEGEKRVDEVLLSYMPAPRSYTAEDVVEINCHGGFYATRRVLELVLKAGARLAEPGEFTKRAFLNGRLDLAQAESVMDIIDARTDKGLSVAVRQLEGKLSGRLRGCMDRLLSLLAHIEASIDFPEYDIPELAPERIGEECRLVLREIEDLLATARTGRIYREGVETVIVGKPNVGKSSLLNALLREQRAIVTELPGTTRDVIEEYLNVKGVPLKIIDTAGIREAKDLVEQIGIEKAKEYLQRADLILFVVDVGQGITEEDEEIISFLSGRKCIVVINKIDIKEPDPEFLRRLPPGCPVVRISVLENRGLEELEDTILRMVVDENIDPVSDVVVSNLRHQQALEKARRHLQEVLAGLENGEDLDLLAIDLRAAWESLGEITGETIDESIVDQIFSQFCIGK